MKHTGLAAVLGVLLALPGFAFDLAAPSPWFGVCPAPSSGRQHDEVHEITSNGVTKVRMQDLYKEDWLVTDVDMSKADVGITNLVAGDNVVIDDVDLNGRIKKISAVGGASPEDVTLLIGVYDAENITPRIDAKQDSISDLAAIRAGAEAGAAAVQPDLLSSELSKKQDLLTAGSGIEITVVGGDNVIGVAPNVTNRFASVQYVDDATNALARSQEPLVSGKVDKVPSAPAGEIAAFTGGGSITNTGVLAENIVLKDMFTDGDHVRIDTEDGEIKISVTGMPTKVSQLTNDTGYVTKSVTNGFARTEDIPQKVSDLTNDAEYVTAAITNGILSAANAYADSATNGLARASDLPKKLSDLTNDTEYVTAAVTNGLVTAAVTNGLVTAAITNGLVTASITNGLVTASITNGLVTAAITNGLVTAAVTNGLVTAAVTNGLVTAAVTNGLVTAAITNGLVTAAITNGLVTAAITNGLVTAAITNGFVTASITNGLVTAAVTNGLVTAAVTNGLVTAAVTNGLVTAAVTNGILSLAQSHTDNATNSLKTAVDSATNALDTAKRDKTDLTITEPKNVHWVWTSNDPDCPVGWLDIANSYGAPKPVAMEELIHDELWGWWITGDIGGYGQATVTTGRKDETTVTINFGPDASTWLFYATATRQSATDTTPVEVNEIALASHVEDKLEKTDVVAPDESATAGQAADAKVTHDALVKKADAFTEWWICSDGISRTLYRHTGVDFYQYSTDPKWHGLTTPTIPLWYSREYSEEPTEIVLLYDNGSGDPSPYITATRQRVSDVLRYVHDLRAAISGIDSGETSVSNLIQILKSVGGVSASGMEARK